MIFISVQFFGKGNSGAKGGGAKKQLSSKSPNKLQQLQAMSNEEFENYLNSLDTMKPNLDDSYDYSKNSTFQKMVADLGVNDKPTVVDKDTFDKILAQNPNTKVLYRGVENGSSISAGEILDQIKYSDGFHIGGGNFGDGLYYTGSVGYAKGYADSKNGIQRAIIDPKAKVISREDLMKTYSKLPESTRTALIGAGLKSVSDWHNDGESHLALKLGYDAIQGKSKDHLIVLNRKVLIIDKENYGYSGATQVAKAHPKNTYTDITDIT